MNVELVNLDEWYDTICQWWEQRAHWRVPRETLSNLCCVCFDSSEPVVAAFLYLWGDHGAQIGWVVSNPEIKGKRVSQGVGLVVRYLESVAIKSGARSIMCLSDKHGLTRKYKKMHYAEIGPNHDLLIKVFGRN